MRAFTESLAMCSSPSCQIRSMISNARARQSGETWAVASRDHWKSAHGDARVEHEGRGGLPVSAPDVGQPAKGERRSSRFLTKVRSASFLFSAGRMLSSGGSARRPRRGRPCRNRTWKARRPKAAVEASRRIGLQDVTAQPALQCEQSRKVLEAALQAQCLHGLRLAVEGLVHRHDVIRLAAAHLDGGPAQGAGAPLLLQQRVEEHGENLACGPCRRCPQ